MSEEEIHEFFNTYLDTIQQIFGEVLAEWDENNYIRPFEDATTEFTCNNCGKCCNLKNHDVWVYPYDMIKWLQNWDNQKFSPLFLTALLPVEDLDDVKGVGLPSQKRLAETYNKIIQQKPGKRNLEIRLTLQKILTAIKTLNPSFDPNSNNCIYYNPSTNGQGHCLIYEDRPLQCRTYPYDYPCFTKITIPDTLEKETKSSLPMCPPETFIHGNPKDGVKIDEKHLENVILEKANYRTSTVLKNWSEESEEWEEFLDFEIIDVLLELFHNDLQYLDRKQKSAPEKVSYQHSTKSKPKKNAQKQNYVENRTKKFIAGKRPQRRK